METSRQRRRRRNRPSDTRGSSRDARPGVDGLRFRFRVHGRLPVLAPSHAQGTDTAAAPARGALMRYLELALSVLAVLIGLYVIAVVYLPRREQLAGARPRPQARERELGLAHRFFARLLGSSYRPVDADFDWLEHYTRDIDIGPVVLAAPGRRWVTSAGAAAEPLLVLEDGIE